MSHTASTKTLKRVLGRKELLAIAVGQTIGAGIMAFTGVAIGITGKSANLAFVLAAIMVLILSVPTIFIGGTVRMRGGMYTQVALLAGQKFAGMFIVLYVFLNITIALYALGFAEYFLALFPGLNLKFVAISTLTILYITNLLGIKGAAQLQNILILVLAAAIVTFIGFGLPEIKPGYFSGPDLLPRGIYGLLVGSVLLIYAMSGATWVVNFGAEAKNPVKDIPIVIIISTSVVAVLYAFMATVAAGVLPVSEVADKMLDVVAKEIMPTPFYLFFMVGGALFALLTTLNAVLAWVTKPILQACVDGWFPRSLGAVNERFKTPHVLLTLFYIVGLVPILTGWDIASIGEVAVLLYGGVLILLSLATIRLPKVVPELWSKSAFRVSTPVLVFFCVFSAILATVQLITMALEITLTKLIGCLTIFVIAYVFATLREKSGKVEMEISYEET